MEDQDITKKLTKALKKEAGKYGKEGSLSEFYSKFSKLTLTKTSYGLPQKDTIGRTLHKLTRLR